GAGTGAAAGVGVGVGAGLGMMMPGMLARSLGAEPVAPAAAAVGPIVTCPGCHSAVAADSHFCPRCGRRLAPNARCARCHAELTGGARFCSACGQAVPGS
ncbi:MAG TPA: zinc ribbon domain-containing protein, partial [Methylomirabilota bacterium]